MVKPWMRRTGREVGRFVGRAGDDVVACIGAVCVVYGVACWSAPAAWIVGGLILLAVAIGPHLPHGGKHGPHQ